MRHSPIRHVKVRRGKRSGILGYVLLQMLIIVMLSAAVSAHETRPIIATLNAPPDGSLELTLSLNLEAAIAGIGTQHKNTQDSAAAPLYDRMRSLPPDQLLKEFRRFEPTFVRQIKITIDGKPVAFKVTNVVIPVMKDLSLPRISILSLAGPRLDQPQSLSWQLDPVLGDSVMRVRGKDGKVFAAVVAGAGASSGPVKLTSLAPQSLARVFWMYLQHGFVHILPKGLDHILFVLGLYFFSVKLRPLLWQVSAFTLAHTVTLALGASGVVAIPPAIVEPLIAASIVFVAAENLFTNRLHFWRLPLIFGFGLLHGLGFAGVMAEIGLPTGHFFTGIIAFNIGVELGQLAVISIAFIAIGWSAHQPWYRRAVTMPASLIIAMVASFWVVERVGFL